MRNSTIFFVFFLSSAALSTLMLADASHRRAAGSASLEEKRRIVKELRLTDLCLFTDTRYTRHPSMADLYSPFQEHPTALEHFPSGSLMGPPPHLERR